MYGKEKEKKTNAHIMYVNYWSLELSLVLTSFIVVHSCIQY
jgi:hypothetical protein